MATYGQLKAQIKRDIRRDALAADSAGVLTDDTIAHYVKSAIDFYSAYQLFTNEKIGALYTAASTPSVDLPSDFKAMVSLTITDNGINRELGKDNYPEYARKIALPTYYSSPDSYAIFDERLFLYPTPDDVYTLNIAYIYSATALSADSDTNAWTEEGYRLIQQRAMSDIYYNRMRDDVNGQRHDALAARELSRLCMQSMQRSSGKIMPRVV